MVALWWACGQLIGLAALPLTLRVIGRLPDRGWHFARTLGLLLVAFVYWQAAMAGLPNRAWLVIASLVVVAAASWWLGRRELACLPELLRANATPIAVGEVVGLVAFGFGVLLRSYAPSVGVNEKPMEMAILNGILRSPTFPPIDPWFAAGTVNYYYFGYVVTAVLVRLTRVPSGIGFNLMFGTLAATTATGAYGLAAALAPRARAAFAGCLAVVFVLLIGNFEPPVELLNAHSLLPEPARAYLTI